MSTVNDEYQSLIAEIAANKYNIEELTNLVESAPYNLVESATSGLPNVPGAVTLLYGGGTGTTVVDSVTGAAKSIGMTDVAETIGSNSQGAVKTVGQTVAGKLLFSDQFNAAVEDAYIAENLFN